MRKSSPAISLIAITVGTACFLTGRWSRDAAPANATTGTASPSSSAATASSRPGHAADDPSSPRFRSTTRPRDATTPKRTAEKPTFPVPRTIVSELVAKEMKYHDFDNLGPYVKSALDLLNATDDEKTAAMAAAKQMREDILSAERTSSKLVSIDASRIRIDMSGAIHAAEKIRETFESNLASTLPKDKADILIGALDRKAFYPDEQSSDLSFSIERHPESGTLFATTRRGRGSMGSGLDHGRFPDNGKPIPADKAFGTRWADLLTGQVLLPVDRPAR